jgi:hypothetical protein
VAFALVYAARVHAFLRLARKVDWLRSWYPRLMIYCVVGYGSFLFISFSLTISRSISTLAPWRSLRCGDDRRTVDHDGVAQS